MGVMHVVGTKAVSAHIQGFPFALVSINITKWAIDAMQQGKLNAVAAKRHSMVEACNLFHVGAMYKFFWSWSQRGGTILDVGTRLPGLEARCKRYPAATIAAADQVLRLPAV